SEKRPGCNRNLLALDAVDAGSADDHVDLLLACVRLVVLVTLAVRCDLEPVDPERLDAEHAADEANGAGRTRALDVVDVCDGVAQLHPQYAEGGLGDRSVERGRDPDGTHSACAK